MRGCVFCDVIAGRVQASIVYRDDVCIAFMDTRPITIGHVLVMPVNHAALLSDLDAETAAHMMRVAQRIDIALRTSPHRCEGVYMLLWDGAGAGQEVFHVHMHAFPAYRNDGFALQFPPGFGRLPPRDELEKAAALIRTALAATDPNANENAEDPPKP
ncbi:MAG: HIT family protein [Gemmatimonadaceae bacterium]